MQLKREERQTRHKNNRHADVCETNIVDKIVRQGNHFIIVSN